MQRKIKDINNKTRQPKASLQEVIVKIFGLSEKYVWQLQFSSDKKLAFIAKESFAIGTRLELTWLKSNKITNDYIVITDNIYDDSSKRFLISTKFDNTFTKENKLTIT